MIYINYNLSDWPKDVFVRLYSPEDILVGELENIPQVLDVRYQIAKERAEGYYLMILCPDGRFWRVEITFTGEVKGWPDDFGKTTYNLSMELRKIQLTNEN